MNSFIVRRPAWDGMPDPPPEVVVAVSTIGGCHAEKILQVARQSHFRNIIADVERANSLLTSNDWQSIYRGKKTRIEALDFNYLARYRWEVLQESDLSDELREKSDLSTVVVFDESTACRHCAELIGEAFGVSFRSVSYCDYHICGHCVRDMGE